MEGIALPEKILESSFWSLSQDVYAPLDDKFIDVRTVKVNEIWQSETYQVIATLDDVETDTQAIAVLKDDQIVVGFRGTESIKDLKNDIDYLITYRNMTPEEARKEIEFSRSTHAHGDAVGLPLHEMREKQLESDSYQNLNDPFSVGEAFLEKVHKEYPNHTINLTGHSWGGTMATYLQVTTSYSSHAVTYAAPNAYSILPDDVKEVADQGEFEDTVVEYRVGLDPLGGLGSHEPDIGQAHLLQGGIPLANHKIANFEMFFNGSGMIRMTPVEATKLISRLRDYLEIIERVEYEMKAFRTDHDAIVRNLQHKFERSLSAEYPRLNTIDVNTIIRELSSGTEDGLPIFYDTGAEDELLQKLNELKKDATEIIEGMEYMVENFTERDEAIASWLNQ